MKLSVIIPAYNKIHRIAFAIEKVNSYLDGKDVGSAIIVVDDGSKEGTPDISGRKYSDGC